MQIKQLDWGQTAVYSEADYDDDGFCIGEVMVEGWHFARAPATDKMYQIHRDHTDGLYYPLWDSFPGYELLENAKAEAQADFETKILEALDA